MAKFYSAYNPPPSIPIEFPDGTYSETLESFVTSDGVKGVRVNGKFNLFDYVQSARLVVDIDHLIDKFSNGDFTALNSRPAQYADVTGMPDNIHELYKSMNEAQKVFDRMDADVKSYYGNDVMQFLANFESDLAKGAAAPKGDVSNETVDG